MARTKQYMLKIKQFKSRIGHKKKAKATLDAMGIKKMNQTVELPDNPAIRGMIKKIEYLIRVEDN